jgi:hypothetical protein
VLVGIAGGSSRGLCGTYVSPRGSRVGFLEVELDPWKSNWSSWKSSQTSWKLNLSSCKSTWSSWKSS